MVNNCESNIDICKAECCKTFVLKCPKLNKSNLIPGTYISFRKAITSDLALYYKYHGVKYIHSEISIFLDCFSVNGNDLIIFRQCDGLTDDLKCKYHNTPQQPKICQFPNKESHKDLKNVMITPNCIYNHKCDGHCNIGGCNND